MVVVSGAPAPSMIFSISATSAAELTLGTTMPEGPASAAERRSSTAHSVSSRVDPDGQLPMAVLPGLHRGGDLVPRHRLHVGGDGVLGVEDDGVGREALGLLERLVVGPRHVQRAAARTVSLEGNSSVGHRVLLRTRRSTARSGSRSASWRASATTTWHCLTEASSSILPFEHDGARAVAHRLDDLLGVGHVGRVGREHPLGDVDLHRVQRPRADAAEQVGVAELVLAGDGVLDVAERDRRTAGCRPSRRRRPCGRWCSARGPAGRSCGRRRTPGRRRPSAGPDGPGSRGDRRRRGWSSCAGWPQGRPVRARGPACAGEARQISSTLATPRAVSRMACTMSGSVRPGLGLELGEQPVDVVDVLGALDLGDHDHVEAVADLGRPAWSGRRAPTASPGC